MSKQLEKIKQLIEKREQARLGGGEKANKKQHDRGKYTARERVEMLQAVPWRRCCSRFWYYRWSSGIYLRTGLHRTRRFSVGDNESEDL